MKQNRIMIIDGDSEFVEEVIDLLEDAGYQTQSASNLDEAVAAIEESLPHLILLDIKPAGNGMDIAEELKSRRNTSDIPIIAVSAYVDDSNREEISSDSRIQDVLKKPLLPLEFIASIEEHLKH